MSVRSYGSHSLYDGSLTATTTAQALPAQICDVVSIQNDPGSAHNIVVGNQASQSWVLTAGSSQSWGVGNTNILWVKGVGGTATVNWQARG